eukprot:COSAG05_NODE_20647_length_278_cov_0.536313_1_plen_64_part_10
MRYRSYSTNLLQVQAMLGCRKIMHWRLLVAYWSGTLKKKNFFNDTATTEIYTGEDTLSLHDALP